MLSVRRQSFVGCLVLAAVFAAPRSGPAQAGSATTQIRRRWVHGSWRVVGGVSQSDYLGNPVTVAADGQSAYLFDAAEFAVKAFAFDGTPKWRLGRFGVQRGEFGRVTGLVVDAQHRLWVSDPDAGRISILSATGQLVRTIDGIEGILHVVPRPDGSFWGSTTRSAAPLLFDAAGQHPRALQVPSAFAHLDPLQAFAWLAEAPDGALATSYYWSGHFVIARRNGTEVRVYDGVEDLAFPKVQYDTLVQMNQRIPVKHIAHGSRTGALASAADRGVLYELFTNHGPDRSALQRTVDAFDEVTGRYIGSYLLPQPVISIAVHDGIFVALTAGATPTIQVWQWVPAHS